MLPPFAETIVLTTLCWHSVAFQRTAADDHTFPNASSDIWKQHTRLYQAVQQRLMLLSLPASSPELNDPMRLFTNMLANSAVIWFHNMLESLQTDLDEQMLLFPLYSAYEIVRLAKPLTRCSYFKVRLARLQTHTKQRLYLIKLNRHTRSLQCYCFCRQNSSRPTPSAPVYRRINSKDSRNSKKRCEFYRAGTIWP